MRWGVQNPGTSLGRSSPVFSSRRPHPAAGGPPSEGQGQWQAGEALTLPWLAGTRPVLSAVPPQLS